MKKLFLVYRVDYVLDLENCVGIQTLWCCDSEEKANSDVLKLQLDFDNQKEQMNLPYSTVYSYKSIKLY